MSYQKAVQQVRDRVFNNVKGIPINLPRLNDYLGGIGEEEMVLLFGATGTSKSKLTLILFVLALTEYTKTHPDQDVKIYHFTLELSANEIWLNIFCYLLHKKTGKEYSVNYFRNKDVKNPLTEAGLQELELIRDELEYLEKHLEIIDSKRQPIKVFQFLQNELGKRGSFQNGQYVKSNPNELVVIIADTINAFQADPDLDQTNSIKRWSEFFCKQTLKIDYRCCIINVQQADKQSTTVQYNYKNERNEDKFVPRIENLAKVKTTPDDHTTVISIYHPYRYEIGSYAGYDVNVLKNDFRYLTIVKSSHVEEGKGVAIYLDSGHLIAEELPLSSKQEELQRFYMNKTSQVSVISPSPAPSFKSRFSFDTIGRKETVSSTEIFD